MPTPTVTDLSGLANVVRERGRTARSITAVAGAPASGKSTFAESLVEALNADEPGSAAVFPMDGYHFDDMILVPRGWRARKGAPHTFDVAGFGHMLARLRANAEPEIAVPVFDRSLEIARNAARIIPSAVRHLVVEGNYLLLDETPWPTLAAHFDTTVFLDVPLATLRARLEARWKDMTAEQRATQIDGNDLPNAELVMTRSRASEFVIRA